MVSEKVEGNWKRKEIENKNKRKKIIDFVLFLSEEYDLKGINVWELTED